MRQRIGNVRVGIVLLAAIMGAVGAGCASTPKSRILERCSLCDTAIVGTLCPKCGVTAYEPTFLSVDEENAAQKKALEQLATMPDGIEVLVSSSPTHKPSWIMGGIIRIQEATGRDVVIGDGSGATESDARTEAYAHAREHMDGTKGPYESMQWYIEKVLVLKERVPRLIFRAYVLSFGRLPTTEAVE